MAHSDSLDELVRDLPPELEAEVEDFILFLLSRRGTTGAPKGEGERPRFSWAGALSHLEGVSAVDLQHEALDEWGA